MPNPHGSLLNPSWCSRAEFCTPTVIRHGEGGQWTYLPLGKVVLGMEKPGPWKSFLKDMYPSLLIPPDTSDFKLGGNNGEPFLATAEGSNVVPHLLEEVGFAGNVMILLKRPDKRREAYWKNTGATLKTDDEE